ncbi:hypothetical protein HK104_011085 [Borealophlyctis nickersoniae]|nr:hypothetical protein HK104_011085 [Borealophlyctis nickersoniae]
MRAYFEKYGEVDDCVVMKDPITGRSRGFGFLTFRSSKSVDAVIQLEHTLDGKIIDPKRAIPREEQDRTEKIFVGGVAPEVTEDVFRAYFERFGRVVDATLMTDRETGRPRGFGFITFENSDGVDKAMAKQALGELAINGKLVEVKRAMPKHRLAQMPGAGTVRAPPALALPAAPVYPPMMDSRVSNFGPMRGARAVTAPVGPRMPPRFAPYGAAGAAGANPYAARFAAAAAAAASGDERFAGRMGAYGYPFAGYAAAAAAGYYPGMSGYGYGGRYDPETMAAYAGAYSRGYHPYYGYGMYGGYGGRYGYGSYGAGAAGYAGREGYRRGGGERGEGSSSPPRRVKEGSQGPRSRGEDDSLELAGGMEDHGRPDEVGSGSGVTIKTERDSERDAGGSSSGPQRPSSSWGSRGGRGFHPYAR